MKKSRILAIITIIATICLIISASIAFPIVIRPFYYLHIKMLDLPIKTGWDYQTIKLAYDQMLDFCMGLSNTFATGALKFSNEGYLHFVDVRKLFIIDFAVVFISSAILVTVYILKRKKIMEPAYIFKHNTGYLAAVLLIIIFVVVGIYGLSDFTRFFTLFHKIFFPGKTNWIFDPYKDEIINVLPEVFFADCCICIVSLLFISCFLLIYKDKKNKLLGLY